MVWEEENIGLVVIVSGRNATDKFDNGTEKLEQAVVRAAESVGDEAISLVERVLSP